MSGKSASANLAFDKGIRKYFQDREKMVPGFVSKVFSIKGAFQLNKKAFGYDMVKVPINLAYMPFCLLARIGSNATGKIGCKKLSSKLEKLPKGFETEVERELNWLIYSELLEIPFKGNGRVSNKDILLATCLSQPEMKPFIEPHLKQIVQKRNDPNFRKSLEENIYELTNCRAAASDTAAAMVSLATGCLINNQFTPGAFTSGPVCANAIAQQVAISNCIFGNTIGSLYYGLFPASASMSLLAATTGGIMAGMGIISAFAGMITDPIQAKLGIHEKRLLKMIKKMKTSLNRGQDTRLRLKGVYVKYIIDMVDVFKSAASI